MRSDTLWRITVLAKQQDGSVEGRYIDIKGPVQPQVKMAVALNYVPTSVHLDEESIIFKPISINKIDKWKTLALMMVATLLGMLIGKFL